MSTEFLKEFLQGEKTAEEKALIEKQAAERKHDVLALDLSGFETAEDDAEQSGCGTPAGGCGGCGCLS